MKVRLVIILWSLNVHEITWHLRKEKQRNLNTTCQINSVRKAQTHIYVMRDYIYINASHIAKRFSIKMYRFLQHDKLTLKPLAQCRRKSKHFFLDHTES